MYGEIWMVWMDCYAYMRNVVAWLICLVLNIMFVTWVVIMVWCGENNVYAYFYVNIYILVPNDIIILFLTLLLFWMLYEALQIRVAGGLFVEIVSSFFCRSALICSTGLSGGSFCDYVYIWLFDCISWCCMLQMTFIYIYTWIFSYRCFRYYSVTLAYKWCLCYISI